MPQDTGLSILKETLKRYLAGLELRLLQQRYTRKRRKFLLPYHKFLSLRWKLRWKYNFFGADLFVSCSAFILKKASQTSSIIFSKGSLSSPYIEFSYPYIMHDKTSLWLFKVRILPGCRGFVQLVNQVMNKKKTSDRRKPTVIFEFWNIANKARKKKYTWTQFFRNVIY